MVPNPDDVSGGSDQDDSDLERETSGMLARPDDSEDDDDPRHPLHSVGGPPADDDDNDDDDDDDDDELPPTEPSRERPASTSGGTGGSSVGTMDQYLMKPSEVAQAKRKSAAQTKEMSKSHKQKAVRTGPSSAWGDGAPPKQHPKPTSEEPQSRPQHFSLHSDDSDDGGIDVTMPQNRGVPMPPPDPCQEFENQRTNGLASTAAANDAAPKVHPDALNIAYVMKNEKVNKWWKIDSSLLVYAPDPRKTVPFSFALEELTIASKPLREAMQKKLCSENPDWMAQAAVIFKLPSDGKLDLPLADASGIVMAVPYTLKVEGDKSLAEFRGKLASEDGTTPDTVYGLLALDRDAIKTAYGVKPSPLPPQFDSTKPSPSTNAKWKVPSKLEEYLKTEDDRFFLGALEKPKRSTSHKRPSEDGARGGGGSSKADSKRPANGVAAAAPSTASARAAAPAPPAEPTPSTEEAVEEDGDDGIVVDKSGPCFTRIKWTEIPSMGVAMAGIKCAPGAEVRLMPAGEGSYILVKTPAGP